MTDILARIRAWAQELDGIPESMLGPFLAAELRQRFPEAFEETKQQVIQLDLLCPKCSKSHVDRGIWATRPHRTHLCEHCGHEWQPSTTYTVGIAIDGGDDTEATSTYGDMRNHARVDERPAKLLETGSPEQVVLTFIVKNGPARPQTIKSVMLYRPVSAAMRKLSKERLIIWQNPVWSSTDAGRAEAAKHEVQP